MTQNNYKVDQNKPHNRPTMHKHSPHMKRDSSKVVLNNTPNIILVLLGGRHASGNCSPPAYLLISVCLFGGRHAFCNAGPSLYLEFLIFLLGGRHTFGNACATANADATNQH